MKPSLANKVVNRHALISSALSVMPLETQVTLSSVFSRSYDVTVPWNAPVAIFPVRTQSSFPKIDDNSDEFTFRTTFNAEIEG